MQLFRFSILYGICLCLASVMHAQEYVTVKAQPKDNITKLLSDYALGTHSCNYKAFKEINGLDSDSDLIYIGTSYKLPIEIHRYNGKSIRSTIGIKSYEQALRIQHYNDDLYKSKVKKNDFRIDKVLWVPHHEMDCMTSEKNDVIVNVSSNVYPIFGAKYQKVTSQSNALKGHVFYIVSGHGGPDPGAVYTHGKSQYCEDEYAYDIALRLARNLVAHGALTYVIVRDPNDGIRDGKYLPPDTDEKCWDNQKIPYSQEERLQQRSDAINRLYDLHLSQGISADHQRAISLHIDSRKVDQRLDVFFYHFPGSESGKAFAQELQKTIGAQYSKYQKNRGYTGTVKARELFVLREIKPTMAFIELGNIQNSADRQRFLLHTNRQALADWLLMGVINAQKN